MAALSTSHRVRNRLRIGLVGVATCVIAFTGIQPATASLKSSSIKYSKTVTVKCSSGKYGYAYVEGNHVSYKKAYAKRNGATHWSITRWTGFNGNDALLKALPKTGGNRTSRVYLALASDTRHSMSSMSKLRVRSFCDSRDLSKARGAGGLGDDVIFFSW